MAANANENKVIVIDDDDDEAEEPVKKDPMECPICLQTCIHPAKLPCGHIFCFLCVKGVAYKNRRCAMCRREIPPEFLDHPQLVHGVQDLCKTKTTEDGYQWFYEGRNGGWWEYETRISEEIENAFIEKNDETDILICGWWQYDERTSQDIEEAYKKGEKSCTILVAGYVYVVDFEAMLQQRQNDPSRRRRVKRDLASIPKKGVAGLRIEGTTTTSLYSDTNMSTESSSISLLEYLPRISLTPSSSSELSTLSTMRSPSSSSILNLHHYNHHNHNHNSNNIISTIAVTDTASRIASDIIGSTLAHADDVIHHNHHSDALDNQTRELLEETEELLNATVGANLIPTVDHNTTTITTPTTTSDLFSETLENFRTLTLRNVMDSSDSEDDNEQIIL